MHAPPRLALLAALGLIALFPSLPLGSRVVAGDPGQDEVFALAIHPDVPNSQRDLKFDIALVSPGAPWAGPLAAYRPEQPLLLTDIRPPYDVLLRSRNGLWAARRTLETRPPREPLLMQLEPRGVLSGVVLDSDGQVLHCLVQAESSDGLLYTEATSSDGSFRFNWLPEGKYKLITPLSVHGRCITESIAIAGQEIHLRLQPEPTQGPPAEIIGQVQSSSGEYQPDLRVRLWPLDRDAAPGGAQVVWQESPDNIVSGHFSIPATEGEEYVLCLEKRDLLPASYTITPITAPKTDIEIFCADESPHTDLVFRPECIETTSGIDEFEVALSWGAEVIWRTSHGGDCLIEGVPNDVPVAWMLRAPGTAPVFGEAVFYQDMPKALITPQLTGSWGEGLHLVLPDGNPAANILVLLDGEPAGRTDHEGLLILQQPEQPTLLSLHTDGYRIFGGTDSSCPLNSLSDRDEFGRLLLVLLPRG